MKRSSEMRAAPRGRGGQGFSLAELLVVVGILVILLSIFVPYIAKAREADQRLRCAANLRAIHVAFEAYARQNERNYPRVRFDPAAAPGYAAFTGAEAADPFTANATVRPNDVTASLWLLLRGRLLVDARPFVCPSTSDSADPYGSPREPAPTARSNFSGPANLSYSYSAPFSQAAKYRLNSDVLPADFAVLADRNPGAANGRDVTKPAYNATPLQMAKANSRNHGGAGQNVLYADGHVQFQATPYCGYGRGWQRDNIYTAFARTPPATAPATNGAVVEPAPEANGLVGRDLAPAWEKDSYLVPAEE